MSLPCWMLCAVCAVKFSSISCGQVMLTGSVPGRIRQLMEFFFAQLEEASTVVLSNGYRQGRAVMSQSRQYSARCRRCSEKRGEMLFACYARSTLYTMFNCMVNVFFVCKNNT